MTLNCLLCRCFINGGLISGYGRARGVIRLSVAVTSTYTQASFIIHPVSGVINRYILKTSPLPLVLLSDFTYRNIQFESFFVIIFKYIFFIQFPNLALHPVCYIVVLMLKNKIKLKLSILILREGFFKDMWTLIIYLLPTHPPSGPPLEMIFYSNVIVIWLYKSEGLLR